MTNRQVDIVKVTPVEANHQVVTLTSSASGANYQRRPCLECPWRVENVGSFPAGAFAASAVTAYDMAVTEFSCHMTGAGHVSTCAGFILVGSHHNLNSRMKRMRGHYADVTRGDVVLFKSYREMAEANGVDPDDPVLAPCRSD